MGHAELSTSMKPQEFLPWDDGLRVLHPFEATQAVPLASVALDLPAEQLFADVEPVAAS